MTFKYADTDSSGMLERDELKSVLGQIGFAGKTVDEVLGQFDSNKDGKIDYKEFLKMMTDLEVKEMVEVKTDAEEEKTDIIGTTL